ncbi:MAG: 3'(2'),5'-bisphosphate nucleotidase CysQ [Bacteroidota bacterium]
MKTGLNDQLLTEAIRAALIASNEIMDVYGKAFDVEHKADNSPLTEADKRAHAAISKVLESTGIPILSEEGRHAPFEERSHWDTLWIVDPLDGTKEFVRRNGEFTVNIALVSSQRPVFGVILAPVTGALYFGGSSMGAYRLYRKGLFLSGEIPPSLASYGEKLPITESDRPYRIVASRSHMSIETQEFVNAQRINEPDLELVNSGSSLKICLIAEGSADIYPRFAPTMEWDTAAGHAIAEGAGKNLVQHDGKPVLYNKADLLNPWFIVK